MTSPGLMVSMVHPLASIRLRAGPPINHVSVLPPSWTSMVNIGCGFLHSIFCTVPFTVTSLVVFTGHEWWAERGGARKINAAKTAGARKSLIMTVLPSSFELPESHFTFD